MVVHLFCNRIIEVHFLNGIMFIHFFYFSLLIIFLLRFWSLLTRYSSKRCVKWFCLCLIFAFSISFRETSNSLWMASVREWLQSICHRYCMQWLTCMGSVLKLPSLPPQLRIQVSLYGCGKPCLIRVIFSMTFAYCWLYTWDWKGVVEESLSFL